MRATHNRAVLAARAGSRVSRNPGRVGVDLAARVEPVKAPVGPVRRSRALPMTPLMRSGDGVGRSAWTNSMEFFTDPKWTPTVSEV